MGAEQKGVDHGVKIANRTGTDKTTRYPRKDAAAGQPETGATRRHCCDVSILLLVSITWYYFITTIFFVAVKLPAVSLYT
jgi:hypothetical protein